MIRLTTTNTTGPALDIEGSHCGFQRLDVGARCKAAVLSRFAALSVSLTLKVSLFQIPAGFRHLRRRGAGADHVLVSAANGRLGLQLLPI